MISNKTITLAAAAFATANAINLHSKTEAEDIWSDIGGAFEDAGEWIVGAGESAWDWTQQAVYDIGDAFVDLGEWMADGDNWTNLGLAIISPVYTPPQVVPATPSHDEMCSTYTPQPGELIPDDPNASPPYYNDWDDTYTTDFNWQLETAGGAFNVIYGAFGDITDENHCMVSSTDCEKVDCMNPCYGDGSCFYCADHLMKNEGERLTDICTACTVPTRCRTR